MTLATTDMREQKLLHTFDWMKRSQSQIIGDSGEELFGYLVTQNGAWIARKLPKDFGIDYEIELSEPNVAGQLIRCQIKTESNASKPVTVHSVPVSVSPFTICGILSTARNFCPYGS